MRIALHRAATTAFALILTAGCAGGASTTQEQVARGAELYGANCVSCHGGATGGDISDIPPRHNAEGHTWHHPDCELIEIVQEGSPQRPGQPGDAPTMPAFGDRLDEDDVRDILAYIKTWWDEDQRQSQQQVTEQVCG